MDSPKLNVCAVCSFIRVLDVVCYDNDNCSKEQERQDLITENTESIQQIQQVKVNTTSHLGQVS